MKTVGIVANPLKEGIAEAIEKVIAWSAGHGLEVLAEDRLSAIAPDSTAVAPTREVAARADLILAFGGDGTLLYAAREVASAGGEVPIFGVNLGSLGFLTQIAGEELEEVLGRMDPSNLPVSERMMLSVTVAGRGEPALALNDVVVTKGAESRMLSFEARVDGEVVTRYAADGLILSTPTGSTAYSVSAGGPIVAPNVEAVIATPICPHTLSMRALVVPPTAVIEVEMLSCDERTIVTTDGNRAFDIATGDVVTVRRAEARARLVEMAEHSYYEILRKKMRWAGRVRER